MPKKEHTFISSSVFPLLFLLAMWAVFFYDNKYGLDLYRFGVDPLKAGGLAGILLMPLLHGDFYHILSNTLPMLVLGTLLFYYYKEIAFRTFFIIYFASGFAVWLFSDLLRGASAPPHSYHIGASALIYGLSGFLFFSGVIRKNKTLGGVTLLVTFLYGSVIWGIFPLEMRRAMRIISEHENISWEGHLFGFLVGSVLAWVFRKKGLQKPAYSWEVNNDADVDESNPYWMVDENGHSLVKDKDAKDAGVFGNRSDNPYTVNYMYFPKKEKDKEDDGRDPLDKDL
jgi:membrane associated rhomboid family serine protease